MNCSRDSEDKGQGCFDILDVEELTVQLFTCHVRARAIAQVWVDSVQLWIPWPGSVERPREN